MENIYIASVNPMHFSHLNTYKEAQIILNASVTLCIGQNDLKTLGLFSIEERSCIAQTFYGIPKDKILLLESIDYTLEIIRNSKRIIRGIRGEKDFLELDKICKHYGVSDQSDKLLAITVPESMREISSSRLIEKIKSNQYRVEDNWIPEGLLKIILKKLNI